MENQLLNNFRILFTVIVLNVVSLQSVCLLAQVKWLNIDAAYTHLPKGFHIFKTVDSLEGKPFLAVYTITDIKNKQLVFSTDTSLKRRLTPKQFYHKNRQPLLVVNSIFFSFATNQNLNIVIKDGKLVSYNIHDIPGKGNDTLTYRHTFNSALGISKKRTADIAWTYSDSSINFAYASQSVVTPWKDSLKKLDFDNGATSLAPEFKKWKMQTAVGGGPVLIQNGQLQITNNEELKFAGKAISDKHPRTLMGYTKDNQLIVMVIEGRNPGVAEGATLVQAAQLMIDLGCVEALNLDGGGSSCMLINGKETIKPSDKGVERAIPAVFIIQQKYQ